MPECAHELAQLLEHDGSGVDFALSRFAICGLETPLQIDSIGTGGNERDVLGLRLMQQARALHLSSAKAEVSA